MLRSTRPQRGTTLIELLVGMVVGLLVATGALGVLLLSLQAQDDNIKLARLNQDLRAMLDVMVRDIRRAGFATDYPETNLTFVEINPFFDSTSANATTDIAVYDYDGGNDNCIVYSYNRDLDSEVDTNERLGFRLASDGDLEIRGWGRTNENCSNWREWETFTEPEVEITALTFNLTTTASLNVSSMLTDGDGDGCYDGDDQSPGTASSSCKSGTYGNGLCDPGEGCNNCTRDGSPDPACILIRKVDIALTGRLRDENSVVQTMSEQVRIRNDLFLVEVP